MLVLKKARGGIAIATLVAMIFPMLAEARRDSGSVRSTRRSTTTRTTPSGGSVTRTTSASHTATASRNSGYYGGAYAAPRGGVVHGDEGYVAAGRRGSVVKTEEGYAAHSRVTGNTVVAGEEGYAH